MSDETRFNPLGNFDPFAETGDTTVAHNNLTEGGSDTVLSETALNGGQSPAAAGSGKIGWKAYTITGISAIALTGGALAGVGAFDSEAAPAGVKATPKAAADETEANAGADAQAEAQAAAGDRESDAAAASATAGAKEGPDYAAGAGVSTGKNGEETLNYAASADNSAATAEATAAPAPDFDHTQYSPVVIEFSDNFGFPEAFASARDLCGVGGTFIWHGQVYSTYYREEWDAMTPAEKDSYLAVANQNHIEHYNEFGDFTPDHYAENDFEAVDDEYGPSTYDDTMAMGPTNDGEDIAMTLGEIRTYDIEDSQMTIGEATIEGHQAVFIDVDNDGVFDVVGIDANDNDDLDEGELVNIEEQGITINDFQEAAQELNPMAYNSGLDDFTNDADVSDFA